MTANVAAAHRHEFSTPRRSTDSQRSSHSTRTPYTIPPNYLLGDTSNQSPSPSTQVQLARREDILDSTPSGSKDSTMPYDGDEFFDGALSRSSSTGSNTTTRSGRKRSQPRSRTSYYFAHPPPTVVKQRLSIRPKLLLQIQKLSASARPLPIYDVLPSTIFAPRLARRYPKVFRGKDGLGANDMVIVFSEEYTNSARLEAVSEEPGDDGWQSRDVLATICQLRKDEGGSQGKAELCLNDGTSWQATPLSNGNYEFITINEYGNKTTARWVTRPQGIHRRSSALQPSTQSSQLDDSKKFNFSLINPSSRRHPIIASLTHTTLDILDSYTSSSSSTAVYPPTPPIRRYSMGLPAPPEQNESSDRALIPTDTALRNIITVTAIWVGFRECWSPSFRYDDAQSATSPSHSHISNRTVSLPIPVSSDNSSRTGSPEQQGHHISLHHATEKLLRPLHRSTASNSFPLQSTPPPVKALESNPRRANSTGTAFMAKRAIRVPSGPTTIRRPTMTPPRDTSIDLRDTPRFTPTDWTPEQNAYPSDLSETPSKRQAPIRAQHVRSQSAYYVNGIEANQENKMHRQHQESKKRFGRFRSLLALIRRHQGAN
jgi:hypothetical protein